MRERGAGGPVPQTGGGRLSGLAFWPACSFALAFAEAVERSGSDGGGAGMVMVGGGWGQRECGESMWRAGGWAMWVLCGMDAQARRVRATGGQTGEHGLGACKSGQA
jgi:hypothetical protein